tara:strand:+ start:532 stop:795 length:264 start_codon:yes stop_codon:yes gene_type:complete
MARPGPNIIKTIELDLGTTWDIITADACYVITYQGSICGIRQHIHTINSQGFKYQKLSYTNLGNALAQVTRLNTKFNCTDFDIKEIK